MPASVPPFPFVPLDPPVAANEVCPPAPLVAPLVDESDAQPAKVLTDPRMANADEIRPRRCIFRRIFGDALSLGKLYPSQLHM